MAVVDRVPCPECQANGNDSKGDNLVIFDDGGATCYACGHWESKSGQRKENPTVSNLKAPTPLATGGIYSDLNHRRITEATCRAYNYTIHPKNGVAFEAAGYTDKNKQVVAQKIRNPNTKEFRFVGDIKNIGLFGEHLVRPGGKMVIVTEGEIDAMSVYEVFNREYGVLSLTYGAATAAKQFKENIDLLNSFDKVVIFFDNDEPGQEAAQKAAEILKPGTAYIANLDNIYKDANEALVANDRKAITKAVYMPKEYRPDGIVHIKDVALQMDMGNVEIFDFPYDCMTQAAYGITGGEVVVMASGSGMGKSTVFKEMIYSHIKEGYTVGALMLEESVTKTKQDIASIHVEQPIHLALTAKSINESREAKGRAPIDFGHVDTVDPEVLKQANIFLEDKNVYLYDHWGSLEIPRLLKRLEYLHYACGCQIIYIDHLSIIVSGKEGSDERRDLDQLMAELKSFAQRTKVAIIAICHLKKSGSQPHEEGGQVSLNDFRGSGALYQYADKCFGFERNQQAGDGTENLMYIRLLKNRFAGKTGIVGAARFYPNRHRLIEVELPKQMVFSDTTKENENG